MISSAAAWRGVEDSSLIAIAILTAKESMHLHCGQVPSDFVPSLDGHQHERAEKEPRLPITVCFQLR